MHNVKSTLFFIAFVATFAIVFCEKNVKYSEKYDFVDVDAILANPRQRNQYYKCFAGEGICVTPDAKFFRDKLLEAITTNCKKCTEAQKINFDKISVYYAEKEPVKYRNLVSIAIDKARNN